VTPTCHRVTPNPRTVAADEDADLPTDVAPHEGVGSFEWAMAEGNSISRLQRFLDEKWAVVQPRRYPHLADFRPRVPPGLTADEAAWFLAAVGRGAFRQAMVHVDEDGALRSSRYPPTVAGRARGYRFFFYTGKPWGEGIVQWATVAKLHHELGWPCDHIVVESPRIVGVESTPLLHQDAFDVLLLEEPCAKLPAVMSLSMAATRVAVEIKEKASELDRLIDEIRACQAGSPASHRKSKNHMTCRGLAALQPSRFLGVAGDRVWRLFRVDDEGLGPKLPPNDLSFD
jgi:hypothetical protein